jgi:uncharacterized membrane protein
MGAQHLRGRFCLRRRNIRAWRGGGERAQSLSHRRVQGTRDNTRGGTHMSHHKQHVLIALSLGGSVALTAHALGDFPPNYRFMNIASANACFDVPDATIGLALGISEDGATIVGQTQNTCVPGDPYLGFKRFLGGVGTMVALPGLGGNVSNAWAVIDGTRAVGFGNEWAGGFEWPRPVSSPPDPGGRLDPEDLGTVGGLGTDEGNAFDIDQSSRVVGYSEREPMQTRATYWEQSAPGVWDIPVDLGTLPGHFQSEARGKNNSNDIVGFSENQAGDRRAVIWEPDGTLSWTITELPTLSGNSVAWDINDSKVIVGFAVDVEEERRAVHWVFNGVEWEIIALATLGGDRSDAFAINGAGEIVGRARIGGVGTERAVLWTPDGVIHNLDSRLCRYVPTDPDDHLASAWVLEGARDINDAGHMVGFGMRNTPLPDGDPLQRPFLLIPLLCAGDLDGDRVVDINDFLVLLAEWDKTCSRADINEDGIVNINDFLLLLADWGCPDPEAEPFPEDAQECIDRYWPDVDRVAACITALNLANGGE